MKLISNKVLLLCSIVGLIEIVLVTYFYESTILLTVLLLGCVAVLFLLVGWSKTSIRIFLILAFSGFLAEAIVVQNGAWTYATQHFLLLPVWLPLLWGSVGLAMLHTIRLLEKV
jgi:hypothetical protein